MKRITVDEKVCSSGSNPESRELYLQLCSHTELWIRRSEELYGIQLEVPEVLLDLHSFCTAGMALANHKIRYNPFYAEENLDDFLARTVPHEVAHIVNDRVFRGRGHGEEWKCIMRDFGLEPVRCHSYPMPERIGNKVSYPYKCDCGTRRFTITRHRESARNGGKWYRCKICRKPLTFVESTSR